MCDEGHLLKNIRTKRSMALSRAATTRRIVLTGTPLQVLCHALSPLPRCTAQHQGGDHPAHPTHRAHFQNNLGEYYTMVNFIRPHYLGTKNQFNNRFVNPIKNGMAVDSSPKDVKLSKQVRRRTHARKIITTHA